MTFLMLVLLVCIGVPVAFIVLGCALEAAPMFFGLLICWWLCHAVGCM